MTANRDFNWRENSVGAGRPSRLTSWTSWNEPSKELNIPTFTLERNLPKGPSCQRLEFKYGSAIEELDWENIFLRLQLDLLVPWHIRPPRTFFIRQHHLIRILERRCHRVILMGRVCPTQRSLPVKVGLNIIVILFSPIYISQKFQLKYLTDTHTFIKRLLGL